MDSLFLNLCVA